MEHITIQITAPANMKIDTEDLRQRREAVDAAVKQTALRLMDKTPAASAPDARPMVTLRELAVRLKMDRSACRRYVLSLGYEPVRQRTADSGFQVALTFTAQQADEIFARRNAEGYC